MPIYQVTGDQSNDESCKTFIIDGENHTLGNALRSIIAEYADVDYCAYSVPHPMEDIIHLRIQMKTGSAYETLVRGLRDLVKVSELLLSEFEKEKLQFDTSNI